MMVQDRRHSVMVGRRFVKHRPNALNSEIAGALLHDVGKSAARLGTFARVLATLVGPRTSRFRQYHDHEAIGAAMLRSINSDELTISMVEGSTDIGGSRASIAMQLAETLGIAAEDVFPTVAFTDGFGYTDITGGSRVTFATGSAAYEAGLDIQRQLVARGTH
jgi:CO/xanthine dehydrogenase Mo-binding subunit